MNSGLIKGVDFTGVCVSLFCHDGKGKYVFQLRSQKCRDEHGRWDNGGGGLKFGERIDDAIKRELQEEYRAGVLEKEFIGFREAHREHEGTKTHWVLLFYRILVDPSQVSIGEPDKCDKLGWFTIDELPKPLHSSLPGDIEAFRSKLI